MSIASPRFHHQGLLPNLRILLFAAVTGAAAYYGFALGNAAAPKADLNTQHFGTCGFSSRDNCVVDGDTFFFDGEKIRIADIDAPETGGAQCASEAELGGRATSRLRELLNEGPFERRGYGSRDTDRYGRKLRIVLRDGHSLGGALVAEGLARRWSGRRMPWCT